MLDRKRNGDKKSRNKKKFLIPCSLFHFIKVKMDTTKIDDLKNIDISTHLLCYPSNLFHKKIICLEENHSIRIKFPNDFSSKNKPSNSKNRIKIRNKRKKSFPPFIFIFSSSSFSYFCLKLLVDNQFSSKNYKKRKRIN